MKGELWPMRDLYVAVRRRNGIPPNSTLCILASEADLYYAAMFVGKVIAKIETRFDVGRPILMWR